jgi:Ca2+-binding RTX toxin-like protein
VELLDVTFGLHVEDTSYRITVTNNVFTNGTITRKGGDVGVRIYNPMFGSMSAPWSQVSPGDVPMAFNFGKPGGNYELKFYPTVDAPSLQNLNATVSAAVAGGLGCTIKGTPGDDTLTGTSGNDVICGLGGNDVIRSKGGDDVIHAGGGQDTIHGGNGNDTVVGGKGHDTIHGGEGADDISGGKGKDTIHHTKGHDWVHGGPHKDNIVDAGF